jgi:hypothetical protein
MTQVVIDTSATKDSKAHERIPRQELCYLRIAEKEIIYECFLFSHAVTSEIWRQIWADYFHFSNMSCQGQKLMITVLSR